MRPRRWILALVVAGSLAFTGCSLLSKLAPDPLAYLCGKGVEELPSLGGIDLDWIKVTLCPEDGGPPVVALVPPVKAPGANLRTMPEVLHRAQSDYEAHPYNPPAFRAQTVKTKHGPVLWDLERKR